MLPIPHPTMDHSMLPNQCKTITIGPIDMISPSFRSEPSRRKSSEVSASMKIRLEAFEDRRKTDSLSDEARAKEKLELG